jgi:hypothetical protein
MKKNLYSLLVLGTMLFGAACSENDSSVAGSTEDPNMRNPSSFDRHTCASIRPRVERMDGDSIYDIDYQCLVIHQNPLNPEDVPDSCSVEETLDARSVYAMDNTWNTDEIADAEFKGKLDSLSQDASVDEATRSCAQRYLKTKPLIKADHNFNILVYFIKSIRCKSDQVYYTKGYKDLLNELGIKNDKDSVEVLTVAKNHYIQKAEKNLNACVKALKTKENIIWDASTSNLKTGVDSLTGTFIGFYENDSAYGGDSHIEWNNEEDKLSGTAVFTKKDVDEVYVSLGIWLDGKKEKKGHTVFDVSNKDGVCFMHYVHGDLKVMLDLGDSLNAVMNDTLYAVELTTRAAPSCVLWDDFFPWTSNQIDKETALKHFAGFRYQLPRGMYSVSVDFEIEKIYFIDP